MHANRQSVDRHCIQMSSGVQPDQASEDHGTCWLLDHEVIHEFHSSGRTATAEASRIAERSHVARHRPAIRARRMPGRGWTLTCTQPPGRTPAMMATREHCNACARKSGSMKHAHSAAEPMAKTSAHLSAPIEKHSLCSSVWACKCECDRSQTRTRLAAEQGISRIELGCAAPYLERPNARQPACSPLPVYRLSGVRLPWLPPSAESHLQVASHASRCTVSLKTYENVRPRRVCRLAATRPRYWC